MFFISIVLVLSVKYFMMKLKNKKMVNKNIKLCLGQISQVGIYVPDLF
jgi:hypothetical protein